MAGDNITFLIVDDEPDMCWALKHVLKANGFSSKTAQNGKEALKILEEVHFDSVFLDAKLPDLEGLELARKIHRLNPEIRIIMISGFFYKDDVAIQQAMKEELICSFISKPFQHEEIARVIESLRS